MKVTKPIKRKPNIAIFRAYGVSNFESFNSTDTFLSPRAGLIFKPIEAVSIYTNYSVSYVPRAGDQLTARNLPVQPTITIRPGAPVRLLVHRDLVLAPRQARD